MTDTERLFRAIALGLIETGLDARYHRTHTEEGKTGHTLVIKNGDRHFQIYVSLRQGTSGIRCQHPYNSAYVKGPELADPKFFEKVKDLICQSSSPSPKNSTTAATLTPSTTAAGSSN